jgi:hypothetical protein
MQTASAAAAKAFAPLAGDRISLTDQRAITETTNLEV